MAQQTGQNAGDQTSSFFWYVVLLAIAFVLIWFFGKAYLIPPIFYIRNAEIYLLSGVLQGWNFLADYLHLPLANISKLNHMQDFMNVAEVKKVTLNQVEFISHVIGTYYRYPLAVLIAGLAYISLFRHRSARFINTYDMNSLKKAEASNWPEITPVVSLDLIKQKLNDGPWAMSKLPLDFCRENNLLRAVEVNEKMTWSIVHGAAERLFVLQMGPMWDDVSRLPIHMKALFVIFLSRVSRGKDISFDLLNQLARSSGDGRLDFTGVEDLVQKYKDHPAVKWAVSRHAYVYTVLATLLELARLEGVLATAEFVWLKPLDRRLWYVLNAVGRSTPVVEAAGVYAHWLAEKKLQRRLSTPVVAEAVDALDKAVGEILYMSEGESWRTNSVA